MSMQANHLREQIGKSPFRSEHRQGVHSPCNVSLGRDADDERRARWRPWTLLASPCHPLSRSLSRWLGAARIPNMGETARLSLMHLAVGPLGTSNSRR